MKPRRLFSLLFSCLLVLGCLTAPVGAVVISDSEMQEVITRATGQFEVTIPANTIVHLGDSVPLGKGETVTYNCTYTPRNASVEFGVIAPDGYFYGLSGSNGSINKGIRVNTPGSYTLAILNESNVSVTVKGTVNY